MLRKTFITLLVGASILFIAGLESSAIPPTKQICEESKNGTYHCETHNIIIGYTIEAIEDLDRWSVLITGIATAFLAYITKRLVDLSREQSNTTRAQLRAYLSIETGDGLRQNKNLRFEFRPVIHNTGQTPAYNVRAISRVELVPPGGIPQTFDYFLPTPAPFGGSRTTIGPGKNRFVSTIFPRRLTFSELREIWTGKKIFHVWGTVTYVDAFKTSRYTNFAYVIYIGQKRSTSIWNNTDRNNDSD